MQRCLRRRARHMFRSVNKKISPSVDNELKGIFVLVLRFYFANLVHTMSN